MNWQQACQHKNLQNLPFKIELDENGRILMSPVKVYHSAYQGKIAALLDRLVKGIVLTECAVKTGKGTKVADVAWMSSERFREVVNKAECSVAPEICVEVLSSGNNRRCLKSRAGEAQRNPPKRKYNFLSSQRENKKSVIVPDFPERIELYNQES